MPRIRTIKPEIHSNRKVGKLSDIAYRLFTGMITLADDEGRLRAHIEELRAKLLPYQPHRKDRELLEAMKELSDAQLACWYGDDGELAYLPGWSEHQRISHPIPSRLAAPPEDSGNFQKFLEPSTGIGRDRKDRKEGNNPSLSGERVPATSNGHSPEWGTPEALIALYNAETPDECPAVDKLTEARRKKCKQYLAQFPDQEFWRECFKRIHGSMFLRGLKPSPGHTHFRASLDWLLSKGRDGVENAVKTWEGRYGEE